MKRCQELPSRSQYSGCFMPFGLHPVPAFGKPVFRAVIAAGFNERPIFLVRHQAGSQREGFNELPVFRGFVVEAEVISGMADFDDAGREISPFQRLRRRVRGVEIEPIAWMQGVQGQQMFGVR